MITLVNNHVLLPHAADWSEEPETKRVWQTETSEALPGSETRQALRAVARRGLSFSFTAHSQEERSRFDARWDAAQVSGLACAPFFGRGSTLAADAAAGDSAVTVELPGAWAWQAGDYVALVNSDTMFDAVKVTGVAAGVLTLETPLDNDWPEGWTAWPLIFGMLTSDKATVLTSWHESLRLTINQLVAERSIQLGAVVPPAGTGIGVWNVNSTFTVT